MRSRKIISLCISTKIRQIGKFIGRLWILTWFVFRVNRRINYFYTLWVFWEKGKVRLELQRFINCLRSTASNYRMSVKIYPNNCSKEIKGKPLQSQNFLIRSHSASIRSDFQSSVTQVTSHAPPTWTNFIQISSKFDIFQVNFFLLMTQECR